MFEFNSYDGTIAGMRGDQIFLEGKAGSQRLVQVGPVARELIPGHRVRVILASRKGDTTERLAAVYNHTTGSLYKRDDAFRGAYGTLRYYGMYALMLSLLGASLLMFQLAELAGSAAWARRSAPVPNLTFWPHVQNLALYAPAAVAAAIAASFIFMKLRSCRKRFDTELAQAYSA